MTDSSLSHESLYWGARKFAHSAMAAHAENEEEIFHLHAGVSIERLAKSSLSKKSPFLLLEGKGSDETLLHLAGVRPTKKVRTVGAAQALTRLRIMGALPANSDLDDLIEIRNGVAHLDFAVEEEFDGLAVFVQATDALIAYLDTDRSRYWGEWLGIADITASQALEASAREVARNIERARYRLGQRLEGVPAGAIDIIYANAGSDREEGYGYGLTMMCGLYTFRSPRECPACRCTGRLTVNLPDLGAGPEGAPTRHFYCPLCRFGAHNEGELLAAGFGADELFLDETGEPVTLTVEMFTQFIQYELLDPQTVSVALLALSARNGAAEDRVAE
ncbi:hypothetical protein WKI68_24835 [Streptomyces sp. MS1.HAVA.3]|uniref:Uncharacterized protein n=1 Tax=Streptomyces caledonius TaxID=3134107 RepID=A0ABU8U775_9ACTN